MTTQKADTRKTTSLLKKYLKSKYGISCKIKSDFYSGGSSLRVEYEMGPDQKIIKAELNCLSEGSFNSMEDIFEYDNDMKPLVIDGFELGTYKYVFVDQIIPSNKKYEMAKFLSDQMNFSDIPKLENESQINEIFAEREHNAWNWSELFSRHFAVRNLPASNFDKMVLKSVSFSKNAFGIFFIYSIDGVEYSTESIEPIVVDSEHTEQNNSVSEVVSGEVQIVDYSEKAIAVIGDTKPIKEKLTELGGKFNRNLKCGPGWIFSKKKHEILLKELSA